MRRLRPAAAAAEPSATETGTLLFVHDVANGPTVGVTVLPGVESSEVVVQGTVPGGQSFRRSLPVGSYRLRLTGGGSCGATWTLHNARTAPSTGVGALDAPYRRSDEGAHRVRCSARGLADQHLPDAVRA